MTYRNMLIRDVKNVRFDPNIEPLPHLFARVMEALGLFASIAFILGGMGLLQLYFG